MLVAKINDECILGVDFLEKFNLGNIFESVFDSRKEQRKTMFSFRVEKSSDFDVLSNLGCFFDRASEHLTQLQKKFFAELLNEFCVFSEQIVAENCEVGEHEINLKDSLSIKQAPHRIPFHMREKVDEIIEEIIIEENRK